MCTCKLKVVDKYAATMGVLNETVIPQHANHLEMCRTITDSDVAFRTICDRMATAKGLHPRYDAVFGD